MCIDDKRKWVSLNIFQYKSIPYMSMILNCKGLLWMVCEWLSISNTSKNHKLREVDSKYSCEWMSTSNTSKDHELREGDSKYFCEWFSIYKTSMIHKSR